VHLRQSCLYRKNGTYWSGREQSQTRAEISQAATSPSVQCCQTDTVPNIKVGYLQQSPQPVLLTKHQGNRMPASSIAQWTPELSSRSLAFEVQNMQ